MLIQLFSSPVSSCGLRCDLDPIVSMITNNAQMCSQKLNRISGLLLPFFLCVRDVSVFVRPIPLCSFFGPADPSVLFFCVSQVISQPKQRSLPSRVLHDITQNDVGDNDIGVAHADVVLEELVLGGNVLQTLKNLLLGKAVVQGQGAGGANTVGNGLASEAVHVLEANGAQHLLDLALRGTVVAADKSVQGREDGASWRLFGVDGSECRSDGQR